MAIICGTDYSLQAAEAATIAARLAARLDEPVVLLHAMDELADWRVDPEAADAYECVSDLARRQLPGEADRLRRYAARVEEVFVTGRPDDALVRRAEQTDARFIVLGSVGRRGPSRWRLGSVTERTFQTSAVPVLVVREAAPLGAWLDRERPLRVMVGTDLSAVSDLAIRWAAGLTAIGPCEMTVVHTADADPYEGRAIERDLRLGVAEMAGDLEIRVVVDLSRERPGRRLARLAASERVDLLIAGTRQRSGLDRFWHGTVAGEALFLAQTNVACVPALAAAERRAEPLPEMRVVLAPTDFSKIGNAALAYAYAVVAPGGTVHLLHVLQPPPFSGGAARPSPDEIGTAAAGASTDLTARLASLVPDDADARAITSHFSVIETRDVVQGITDEAARLGVDAICMGTHGRSWMAEAVVGSVARGVASRTRVPLLLIRSPGTE